MSAGVKPPPLGPGGNKLLRTDSGHVSRSSRSVSWEFPNFSGKDFIFSTSHFNYSFLCSDDRLQFSSSQPDIAAGGWEAMLLIGQNEGQVSFSQPNQPENMLLGSQLLGTPGASQVTTSSVSAPGINLIKCLRSFYLLCFQSPWQRLVRRMTRFFTNVNADDSLTALKDACDSLALGLKVTCNQQVRPFLS